MRNAEASRGGPHCSRRRLAGAGGSDYRGNGHDIQPALQLSYSVFISFDRFPPHCRRRSSQICDDFLTALPIPSRTTREDGRSYGASEPRTAPGAKESNKLSMVLRGFATLATPTL